MQRAKSFFKYWLPVLAVMALVFSASSDAGSWQRSSRIIRPLVRWMFPNLDDDSVHTVVVVVRKCAHLTEFALLAVLIWRALAQPPMQPGQRWKWATARLAFVITLVYAAADEFHQSLVPGRQAAIQDVVLDGCGAVLGLFLLWAFGRWRKWW